MPKFKLLNPDVAGTIDTTSNLSNPIEAANEIYNRLSSKFANSMDKFHFTLLEGGSKHRFKEDNLYHFTVKEKIDKNTGDVNYNLASFKGKLNFDQFYKEYTDKTGGKFKAKRHHKRKDDDDSSSSDSDSDSPYYRRMNYPLYSWLYYPSLYTLSSTIPLPVFNMSNAPVRFGVYSSPFNAITGLGLVYGESDKISE
jgi:hypothetical protein